jgi:hypothetical protein
LRELFPEGVNQNTGDGTGDKHTKQEWHGDIDELLSK